MRNFKTELISSFEDSVKLKSKFIQDLRNIKHGVYHSISEQL